MGDDASEAGKTPVTCRGLAEREAVDLRARVAELDLEPAGGDGSCLADQLVRALLADDPAAIGVHVDPVGAVRRPAIEEDPERDRSSSGCRSHDEVEVARVKLEGDAAIG